VLSGAYPTFDVAIIRAASLAMFILQFLLQGVSASREKIQAVQKKLHGEKSIVSSREVDRCTVRV